MQKKPITRSTNPTQHTQERTAIDGERIDLSKTNTVFFSVYMRTTSNDNTTHWLLWCRLIVGPSHWTHAIRYAFRERRISHWIFTFVNFGRIHDWRIGKDLVWKHYQLAPSSSRTSGCQTHFSWTRNNRTSILPPQAMSSFASIILARSRAAYGECLFSGFRYL